MIKTKTGCIFIDMTKSNPLKGIWLLGMVLSSHKFHHAVVSWYYTTTSHMMNGWCAHHPLPNVWQVPFELIKVKNVRVLNSLYSNKSYRLIWITQWDCVVSDVLEFLIDIDTIRKNKRVGMPKWDLLWIQTPLLIYIIDGWLIDW